jgi:hypothetical protein
MFAHRDIDVGPDPNAFLMVGGFTIPERTRFARILEHTRHDGCVPRRPRRSTDVYVAVRQWWVVRWIRPMGGHATGLLCGAANVYASSEIRESRHGSIRRANGAFDANLVLLRFRSLFSIFRPSRIELGERRGGRASPEATKDCAPKSSQSNSNRKRPPSRHRRIETSPRNHE